MKSVAATLVFALYALVLPLNIGAEDLVQYDYATPHYDPGAGYTCITCHTTNLTLGSTGYNNVCLTCHRAGDSKAGSMPFTIADAANPFGNHSTVGAMYQTSHRWDGPDTVPAAGAQKPLMFNMNSDDLRTRTGNGLACVRCHDPHRNDNSCATCHDPNYKEPVALGPDGQLPSANFLRVSNDNDQLCLDCHRSRNVSSHQQGSHPVLVNYSSNWAANPGYFNYPPVNANAANPSSDLGARLASSGKQVLCTTCHAVHFADSRSSTLDGKGTFANLSSGDGYVLRTDRRGAGVPAGQPDSVNICTNCHASKSNHNYEGQDIQCGDCHGAHVEYDADDPTGAKGINAYLIRRNVTRDGSAGKIYFRYTSAAKKEYVNSDGAGVCQRCHAVPSTDIHTGLQPTDCSGCHVHGNSKGSFSAKCVGCHAYPPALIYNGTTAHQTDNKECSLCHGSYSADTHATPGMKTCLGCHPVLKGSHTAHIGNIFSSGLVSAYSAADSYFSGNNSDSTGYRFGCASCHPAINPTHMTLGWKNPTLDSSVGAAGTKTVSITCNTTYCHSDGRGTSTASPDWYNPAGYTGDKCAMCHAAVPASGSHSAHLALNGIHAGASGIDYGSAPAFNCERCHIATVNSAKAIINYSNHVNGQATVAFDAVTMVSKAQIAPASFSAYSGVWSRTGGYKVDAGSVDTAKLSLAAGSYDNASKTCSTVACHNNGKPTWGSAPSCVSCHSQL